MSDYQAPLQDMRFVLHELAQMEEIAALPGYEEATPDLVQAILDESARFHAGVIAPLNRVGDTRHPHIAEREVKPSPGFGDAYRQYAQAGWNGLAKSPAYGGQGLPHLLSVAVIEMTQSASIAFSLCPMLTQGAINALEAHGSAALKDRYLEPMISGRWTGTMNLTEPQAGSDLAAVACRAEPDGDHYRLYGQKIYITWGDHDMTENIVHLVLARTPDAPAGAAGISLFLVPKYRLNADGSPGPRNDVYATALEHKLGIHGSPTCVMTYGETEGAVGYLVGEENRGLAHMFTMMNIARLDVGLQGLAVSERAYQQARAFARERVQGSRAGQRITIIHHPDVRRMLMLMRAGCEAMRALAYTTQACVDRASRHPDAAVAAASQARVDLMTPIVKGWLTEMANELTSLGVQIHGGMGFIEETGAAQHYRDARILAIYEGTNGIQALDLIGRKLVRDGGRSMAALLAEMTETRGELQGQSSPELQIIGERFGTALDHLHKGVEWVLERADDKQITDSVAFDLLMLAGYTCGGWQMARAALTAQRRLQQGGGNDDEALYRDKLVSARFYAEHLLPRTSAHLGCLQAGADAILGLPGDRI